MSQCVWGGVSVCACVSVPLPACLFRRWLPWDEELWVGLLPLGRKSAAPFTVRKLSLILEETRRRGQERREGNITSIRLEKTSRHFIFKTNSNLDPLPAK